VLGQLVVGKRSLAEAFLRGRGTSALCSSPDPSSRTRPREGPSRRTEGPSGQGETPFTEPGVTYRVTGFDPYDLDRDNDRRGCE
jgi:hypothetical protein